MTLHLSTKGTNVAPKMRKHNCVNKEGCLCPPQKGKRDYMNTKEYKLLAQKCLFIFHPFKSNLDECK